MNKLSLALTTSLVAAAILPAAVAASGAREISTSEAHAQMAAAAENETTAVMHLHHVVNCLVGPAGKGFDAKAGDPCKGMGKGALIDATPAERPLLKEALRSADAGLKARDLAQAKKEAREAVEKLKQVEATGG